MKTIKNFLETEWWYWNDDYIKANSDWFRKDAKVFAEHFAYLARAKDRDNNFINVPNNFGKVYLFFPDMDEKFGIWQKVILEFNKNFSNKKEKVLLCCVTSQQDKVLLEKFIKDNKCRCSIHFFDQSSEAVSSDKLFSIADYYITSRSGDTVRRTCLADKFDVAVLSGTDEPIFF